MNEKAIAWITGSDTGTSSKTIWAVMMGGVKGPQTSGGIRFDIPYDPSDFGRCYRLLQRVPEWRGELHKVAAVFPAWGPMVAAWGELEALYEEELAQSSAPKLYERMQELVREGWLADGWKQTSPGSWERDNTQTKEK